MIIQPSYVELWSHFVAFVVDKLAKTVIIIRRQPVKEAT
jgi:hypothetical protein